MRVEDLLSSSVATWFPDRPAWVATSPRNPRVAAGVYGRFALGFSTLFFALAAVVVGHPGTLVFVPVVVANAMAWTWMGWAVLVPATGVVSRRRAIVTGLGIGTASWLTVGPLVIAVLWGYSVLTGVRTPPTNPVAVVLVQGAVYSVGGFLATLAIPTLASVGLALWTLDYEVRSGREKRERKFDFE